MSWIRKRSWGSFLTRRRQGRRLLAARPTCEPLEDRIVPIAVPPPPGLVAWWTGDDVALDIAGGHSGILHGAGTVPGYVGDAFSFDGVDDSVEIPASSALEFTASFSIEGWILVQPRPDGNINTMFIVSSGDDYGSAYRLVYGFDQLGLLEFGLPSILVRAPIPTEQFVHVAVTLDDATGALTLYENGSVVSQTTTAARPFPDPDPVSKPGTFLGNFSADTTGPYHFNGLIDELSLYNRALTAAEVQSIYQAGSYGKIQTVGTSTRLQIGDATVAEGDAGLSAMAFTVQRTGNVSGVTTVNWATVDDSATVAGGDYVPGSGQVRFDPGDIEKTVVVAVNGDTVEEGNETFHVELSGALGGAVLGPIGVGTILEDDGSKDPGKWFRRTTLTSLFPALDAVQDASGNLYAVGSGQVQKYDATGKELWTVEPSGGASALALDSSGNVCVVGGTFVRKVDPDGNELWTRQYGSSSDDVASAVTVDAAGTVYVVGKAGVRVYGANGSELWTRPFAIPGLDTVNATAVDAAGNLFVTGWAHGLQPGQPSAEFERKFDAAGNELWARQFDSRGYSYVQPAVFDANDNLYITGSTSGPLPGESDGFVRKYDADGNELWLRPFGTDGIAISYSATLDPGGNLYVAGVTNGALPGQTHVGYTDAFLRKYDAAGNELWTRQFGADHPFTVNSAGGYLFDTNLQWRAFSVSVDAAGNVGMTGFVSGQFAAKLGVIVPGQNFAPLLIGDSLTLTPVSLSATDPPGDLVATVLTDAVLDIDKDAAHGMAVTAVTGSASGTWQYSLDAGKSWQPVGPVSEDAARLLPATSRLRFVPLPGFGGTAAVTFHAWDQTSGLPGSSVDLTGAGVTGGTSAFSTATRTAVVQTRSNEAPALTAGNTDLQVTKPPTSPILWDLGMISPEIGVGQSATLTGKIINPDTANSMTLTVNWGDNTSATYALPRGTNQFSESHIYAVPPNGSSPVTYTVNAGLTSSAGTATIAPVDAAAWWKLDGNGLNSPANRAADFALQPQPSSTNWTFAAGKVGLAASFGSGRFASTPDTPVLHTTGPFTVEAWINPADVSANSSQEIIDEIGADTGAPNPTTDQFMFRLVGSSLQFLRRPGSGGPSGANNSVSSTATGPVIAANTWTHVAAEYVGGRDLRIYVNGIQQNGAVYASAAAAYGYPIDDAETRIGNNAEQSAPFTGLIDEVGLYRRALTGDEIAALIQAGNAGLPRDVTSLITFVTVTLNPVAGTTGASEPWGVSPSITTTVAQLLGANGSDPDGDLLGIAITAGTVTSAGTWQYSLDDGQTWLSPGPVSETNALLLGPTARLRFLPAPRVGGRATLTYRAWDQTNGSSGSTTDLTASGATGFASAFSAASRTATQTNVAPQLSSGNTDLDTSSATTTVAGLLGTNATDADRDVPGIAVTDTATAFGAWQYSLDDGQTWLSPGPTSAANALLLPETARLRFVPQPGVVGQATLSYCAWDQSAGTPGGTVDLTVPGATGGKTAFSSTSRTATIMVGLTADMSLAIHSQTVIRRHGTDVELFDPDANLVFFHTAVGSRLPPLLGSADVPETVTLDFAAGGAFPLPGGLHLDAGAGPGDQFVFRGTDTSSLTVTPGHSQVLSIGSATVSLDGVDAQQVTGVRSLTVRTGGGNDELVTDTPVAGQSRLSGGALAPLTFFDVAALTVDLGAKDAAAAVNRLTVTAPWASGLASVTVLGGAGSDSLSLSPVALVLPKAGGAFRFLAGSGTDTVEAAGDTNWTLRPTYLRDGPGGTVLLSGVEQGRLNGGAGANVLDASGFTGTAWLSGQAGNDTLRGGPGLAWVVESADVDFALSSASLVGLGTDRLFGMSRAALTGGTGNNTFTLSGWIGPAVLDGGGGADTVVAAGNVNFTLTDSRLVRNPGATVSLAGIEQAQLTGGPGNNTFTVSGWTGSVALVGGGGTDTVVAAGDVDMTLTDGLLIRAGRGDVTLKSIEAARLSGGDGANRLDASGFSGRVVLVGGAGDDILVAGAGRSILIGGDGVDRLTGGPADDVLIAGSTRFDANDVALAALLAEWGRSDRTYQQRVPALRSGLGLNTLAYRLMRATVQDDQSADALTGGSGSDWFWATQPPGVVDALADRISRGVNSEAVN